MPQIYESMKIPSLRLSPPPFFHSFICVSPHALIGNRLDVDNFQPFLEEAWFKRVVWGYPDTQRNRKKPPPDLAAVSMTADQQDGEAQECSDEACTSTGFGKVQKLDFFFFKPSVILGFLNVQQQEVRETFCGNTVMSCRTMRRNFPPDQTSFGLCKQYTHRPVHTCKPTGQSRGDRDTAQEHQVMLVSDIRMGKLSDHLDKRGEQKSITTRQKPRDPEEHIRFHSKQ